MIHLGRTSRKWDNIKMDLRKLVDCIHPPQDRVSVPVLIDTGMRFSVSIKCCESVDYERNYSLLMQHPQSRLA
jgi:hypothetical protein